MDCIFCRIINKDLPAEIVYEDEKSVVFRDIKPKAPIHLLAVPKKHISSANDVGSEDRDLIGDLFLTARKAAQDAGLKDSGYKIVVNVGKGGGQEVFHLHFHIIGGWKESFNNK